MIAIKYQIFFFDPKQKKERQLTAIRPAFNSPGAIDALIKSLKFENKEFLIVIGLEDNIETFIKLAEKVDLEKWLDLAIPQRKEELIKLAKSFGLTCTNSLKDQYEDNQVLGDPPQVTAASYPIDLPPENKAVWDSIKNTYRAEINRGKDKDEKMAIQRILYQYSMKTQGIPAWLPVTFQQLHDMRIEIGRTIVKGEEEASALLDKWFRYLKSEGIAKTSKKTKIEGAGRLEDRKMFYLAHTSQWSLAKTATWKELSDYLVKKVGLKKIGGSLKLTLNRRNEIELHKDDTSGVTIYISHYLTEQEAAVLTQEVDETDITKTLNKYLKQWYKTGDFPNLGD